MVAARTSDPGLSPADLERIRDTLALGRKPKVSFTASAGQIAGQLGQVVALTDPQLSDEWLVVRFGRDELPFAPADLSMNTKVAPRRPAAVPVPREEPVLSPAVPASPAATGQSPASPGGSPAAAATPASSAAPAPASPAPSPAPAPARAVTPPAPPAPRAAADSRPAARKPPKVKPAPSLTVTLAYADGEWLVSASQGTKVLAKPYLVRPAEALKMVSMLDVPGVHEAVEEIVSSARAEAQQQADRLRAELAEVEARLAELREQP